MKKRAIFFTFILLIANSIFANPNFVTTVNPTYDEQSELITPDKVYLAKAIKQYNEGYNQLTLSYFKKAAAFGNSEAQKYIGLMNIKSLGVERDWALGYAWIRLAALDHTHKHEKLKQKIFSQLLPEEIERSNKLYDEIHEDYSPHTTLLRRNRWVSKLKHNSLVVGSRTGSLALSGKILTFKSIADMQKGSVSSIKVGQNLDAMSAFIVDYDFGTVTSGEITPVNNTNNKEPL